MMDRIERLTAMLAQQPGDSFLQHALALEYVKVGDEARAREIFEALLKQDDGYVGSYYHLAKLLERVGEVEAALAVYEKGMLKAKAAGDSHAYNELQAAYEDLFY